MGLCGSSPAATKQEKTAAETVEKELREAKRDDRTVHKLLLLGAGESGKSTLFKQMIQIYGKGFNDQDMKSYLPIMYRNTITNIKVLIKYSEELPLRDEAKFGNCKIADSKAAEAAKFLTDYKYDDRAKFPQEVIDAIKLVWKDQGIQNTYNNRSHYQLVDGTKFFLDTIDEWTQPSYMPSVEDILRCRVRTTGIVENDFTIDNNKFKLVDVGGQRNERKKWMHCFDSVTALLFVAAMSEYDQMLYEDENVRRMDEALMLFENICNSRWFRDTSVILFLNKCDLFKEKIARVPLTVCWPEFEGDANNYDQGCAYIEKQFTARNHHKKQVYCHITCATDQRNVKVVFNGVKDIVIREALDTAGLV